MYSEIGFLFNPSLGLDTTTNADNTSNIYGRKIRIRPATADPGTSQGQATQTNQALPGQDPNTTGQSTADPAEVGILVYKRKDVYGTDNIRNYLASDVYRDDESNEDPYISLIHYFNGSKTKALTLRAADFAYLKDLGVYPINRLWILRRFPDNCIVPNNLLEWGKAVEPISTVIGWMKDKEDNPMVSLSFNEVWVDQNNMLDKVLAEILSDNFGLKLSNVMSVPGWSQGILFGMLSEMKLTQSFDAQNVPTGDPNVLRIAKMREVNSQGLASTMTLNLETTYEQKYINGIDPGLAMMDILSNLFKMGTSDQKFILGGKGFADELTKAYAAGKSASAWLDFIKELIKKFITAVETFIKDMGGSGGESSGTSGTSGGGGQSSISGFGSTVEKLGGVLFAGTVAKYRWPLKGSIALMSGINTTPWHLTIGNPYSPIINIGNVYVNNVDVKLSNDLGFNDMPARIDATISTQLGRPLGKQELEKMFNNGYKRVYSQKALNEAGTNEISSNTTPSGIPAPYNSSNVGMNNPDPNTDTPSGFRIGGGGNNPYIPLPPSMP